MLMAWAESDFAVPVEAVERQQRLLMEQFFCGATDSDVEGGEPSETVRTPREA